MTKAQVKRERYKYGIKNLLAMQVFRGKMFYEKVCYHCGDKFLTVRQDSLGCPKNTCQATISRRLKNEKPLRPVKGCRKYPKMEIDFVKWGMSNKKE